MNDIQHLSVLPPLSLYIHIPWCLKKCPYCDFNSHAIKDRIPEKIYIDALLQDLDQDLPWAGERELQSIFFGGGTPSLLTAESVAFLLKEIARRIEFSPNIEITLETNPGTFEYQKFLGFQQAGVNRLSIGVQSFDDAQLMRLGRVHNQQEAINAAVCAKQLGFNFNLDLMHGLPGQSCEDAMADLATAIHLGPDHLSWYQLTLEPNTAFFRHPPTLPQEDTLAEIQHSGSEKLKNAGYTQYEISAFARAGRQSRHNLNYWQFGDYLGIGAGAHGKLTVLTQQLSYRTRKTRHPDHYLERKNSYMADKQAIAREDLALEFMMNALRLVEGVPIELFQQRTGLAFEMIRARIEKLQQQGLLITEPQQLCASPLGLRFLNDLLERFDETG